MNQLTKFNLVSYHDHDEPDLVFRENFLRHLVWQTQPGGGGGAPEHGIKLAEIPSGAPVDL